MSVVFLLHMGGGGGKCVIINMLYYKGGLNMELKKSKKEMLKLVNIPSFILLLALCLLSAILFVIAPITLNTVIENVGRIGIYDILKVISILALGYIVDFISVFTKNQLVQDYHTKCAGLIYSDIFKLDYDKYINEGPTALRELAYNAVEAYASFYFDVIPNLLVNVVTIVVTIAVAWSFNYIAALFMLAIIPIHYFGFKALNKKLSKLSINLQSTSSESFKNINSLISQVDFIKQNAENENLLPAIEDNIHKSEGVRKKVNYVANGASGLLIGLNQIIQNLVIIFLAALALNDKNNFGSVIFVMLVFPYFSNAIRGLSFTNLGFANVKAADNFLKTLIDFKAKDGSKPMPEKIESIKFDIDKVNILDKNLLNNVKMEFKKGDIVGVMGESGTGKSTLLKLIPKFRETDGIYINDIPISEIKNKDYLRKVSYYSQNTPIITDTLYNNLNFGRKKVSKAIYEAMPFLAKFTKLDEMIVENGANLSGGDKQRIALSRYFTEDADIVILDEPTSSLDKETEEELMKEILKDTKDKIVFIISHNKEIMKYCSHLIEIKNKTATVL